MKSNAHGKNSWIPVGFLYTLALSGAAVVLGSAALRQQRDNRALIAAIKENNASKVAVLLERGADPNTTDRTGPWKSVWRSISQNLRGLVLHQKRYAPGEPTALLVVCRPRSDANGNTIAPIENATILQALLDSGADVNATDAKGFSALSYAMAYGAWATARSLVERGAQVNCRSLDDEPLLFSAVMQPDLLRLFLERGANANARSANGSTPLMVASEYDQVESAKLLLAYGAHIDSADAYGDTALTFAEEDYAKDCVRLLKTAGAKS